MAKFRVTETDPYYIAVEVAELSDEYASTRTFEWFLDDVLDGRTTRPPYSTGASYTFYPLTPGTRYSLSVTISGLGNSGGTEIFADLYLDAWTDDLPPPPPPDRFNWDTAKVSGGNFNLTANEWNKLTASINAVRTHPEIGVGAYSFTTAYRGNSLTASMYNQAVRAIKGIPGGYGGYLSEVQPGWDVTAQRLNGLRDELNAVFYS